MIETAIAGAGSPGAVISQILDADHEMLRLLPICYRRCGTLLNPPSKRTVSCWSQEETYPVRNVS